MAWKERPPEDAEPLAWWEWANGLLFAGLSVTAFCFWLYGVLA